MCVPNVPSQTDPLQTLALDVVRLDAARDIKMTIWHINNILTKQFVTGISRNQSHIMLLLTECLGFPK